MELTTYTMSIAGLQEVGNNSITLFIDALVNDGILSPEKGEHLKGEYAIVVYRKGFFGRFLDKLWNTGDNETSMKIARFSAVPSSPEPVRPKLQLVQNETPPS